MHSTPPIQTLVLDGDGRIRANDRGWSGVAHAHPMGGTACELGTSYFEYCAAAAQSCDESGARALRDLTEAIRRMADAPQRSQRLAFVLPNEHRNHWYAARITGFDHDGDPRVVVAFEDVTEAHDALQRERLLAQLAGLFEHVTDIDLLDARIAVLAGQWLGDVCWIAVVENDGSLRCRIRVDAGGVTRTPDALAPGFEALPASVRAALRSGEPAVVDELQHSATRIAGEREASALVEAGAHSAIVVPLLLRGRAAALLTAVRTDTPGRHGDLDLEFGRLFAVHAGRALATGREHARALRETQEKTRALATVSHDLRNSLSTIQMAAQLVRDVPLDERNRQHHLERIERTAESLTHFVGDLLDVARLEEGGFPLRLKLEDVGALLRELVWRLEPSAQQHGVTLNAVTIGDVPAVLVDRERMLQALGNLVLNALKFAAAGGHVQVQVQQDGDRVRFAVADDGCGIPAADLDLVFEPYWQQKRNGRDGAGLGLTIVRGIVEAHRGHVWVESSEGAGTAFYIAVPTHGSGAAPTAVAMRSGRGWPRPRELWLELRRRYAYRVAAVYGAVCFLVLLAADTVLPTLDMPAWTLTALSLAAFGGMPVAVLIASCFELERDRGIPRRTMARSGTGHDSRAMTAGTGHDSRAMTASTENVTARRAAASGGTGVPRRGACHD